MTQLQRRAWATVPLTEATVESFYDGTHSGTERQCLKALCESHERLRAELEGADEASLAYRGELERLTRYAATAELRNTTSWLTGLMERLNASCATLRNETRFSIWIPHGRPNEAKIIVALMAKKIDTLLHGCADSEQ